MPDPTRADLVRLSVLARAASASGSRREWDKLHREVVFVGERCGWVVLRRGNDDLALAPPGTRETRGGMVAPSEVLVVRASDGEVAWADPGEIEALPWPLWDRIDGLASGSGPALAIPGVAEGLDINTAVAAALAAVEAAAPGERSRLLAAAFTLLDDERVPEAPERERPDEPSARRAQWLAEWGATFTPLLDKARAGGPEVLGEIGKLQLDPDSGAAFQFVQLALRRSEEGEALPEEAIEALAEFRHAEADLTWEGAFTALATLAPKQPEPIRRILGSIDPLDADEAHIWTAAMLRRVSERWAHDEILRRAGLLVDRGAWGDAADYALALQDHASPEAAAFLDDFIPRFQASGHPSVQWLLVDLQEARAASNA